MAQNTKFNVDPTDLVRREVLDRLTKGEIPSDMSIPELAFATAFQSPDINWEEFTMHYHRRIRKHRDEILGMLEIFREKASYTLQPEMMKLVDAKIEGIRRLEPLDESRQWLEPALLWIDRKMTSYFNKRKASTFPGRSAQVVEDMLKEILLDVPEFDDEFVTAAKTAYKTVSERKQFKGTEYPKAYHGWVELIEQVRNDVKRNKNLSEVKAHIRERLRKIMPIPGMSLVIDQVASRLFGQ